MKERKGGREGEGRERGAGETVLGREGTEDIDRLGQDGRNRELEAPGLSQKQRLSFPGSTDWP